jgi:hypothetical protein
MLDFLRGLRKTTIYRRFCKKFRRLAGSDVRDGSSPDMRVVLDMGSFYPISSRGYFHEMPKV